MYESYRIVERKLPTTTTYLLQTNTRPTAYAQFGSPFGLAQPEQKWFVVGTYATLEQAEAAKRLFADGLSAGDKVVG